MIALERPASAVLWARVFIHPALKNGSRAVDATAGNGLDTLFLAENVGPDGQVFAFDIQDTAIEKTNKKLAEAGLAGRVKLILGGHQHMGKLVGGQVDAVMFNLGYLPGSDRTLVTAPETTREGIAAALKLLRPGGRLSIVVYTGHPGASEESLSVAAMLSGTDEKYFSVQKIMFWNSRKESPELYFVTRTGEKND